MRAKNISRYTYKRTSFQGWRLSITRSGYQFTKYFSDKQHSNCRAAFQAAVAVRNRIFGELKAPGADPEEVFARYRAELC